MLKFLNQLLEFEFFAKEEGRILQRNMRHLKEQILQNGSIHL